MSLYSDWRCGAISDMDYIQACKREERMDRFYDDRGYLDDDTDDSEDDDDDEVYD